MYKSADYSQTLLINKIPWMSYVAHELYFVTFLIKAAYLLSHFIKMSKMILVHDALLTQYKYADE
jgi:hypothetical protein